MSAGKLWVPNQPGHGARIRCAAALGGLDISLPENFEYGVTNKTPEYMAKFPAGKIPAFECASGLNLYETSAISRYIAGLAKNANLLGSTLEESALVDQWISVADTEISTPVYASKALCAGRLPYNKPIDTYYREKAFAAVQLVESHLKSRTYLVTERITLADITMASTLKAFFQAIGDAPYRAQNPNIVRFCNTIINHPKLKDIFGPAEYVETAIQYVPPAKPAKAAPAPKEKAAPKPAAAAAEEDDDDEPSVPAEPKAKNPLDSLAKSTFNLEDWKRAYSNMDTRGATGALEWLYPKFDKEGYSIWKVVYKYNDELTLVFMSSNLISGFFNRLEASRKYAFGSMGVLGANNDAIIAGAFICRGDDYKPVMDVAPDWESYSFERLDLDKPEDKAYFESAMAWDLEMDGKTWAVGKAFK